MRRDVRSVVLENWLRDDGGKRKSEREKVVIVNGKKLVGLAVAHIPRGSRPSREAIVRGVQNCRGGNERV